MKTLSQMAGSPQSVTLGGREYILSPIDLSDLGELMDWIQYEPLREARKEVEEGGDILSEDDRKDIVRAARRKVEDFRDTREGAPADKEASLRSHEYMIRKMSTIEGMQYILWLGLRKAHPDLSREDVSGLVTAENKEALQERIDDISYGVVSGAPEEKKTPETMTETPPSASYWQRIGRAFSELWRAITTTPPSKSEG